MRKKSSNEALKSLFVMCFFLVFASFLAPGVLDIWASTQKNDFRRDLAREWSEPIGDLSRKIKFDEIRDFSERIIDTSPSEQMLEPLVKQVLIVPEESFPILSIKEAKEENDSGIKATELKSTSSNIENLIDLPPSPTILPPQITADAIATTTTTTTTLVNPESLAKIRRTATVEDPLRILAVGDSLMLDFQYGLERILEARPDVNIEGRGALGFGFTVPYWDWEDDVIPDYNSMVRKVRPDIVIAMIGANEFQGYAIEGEDLEPGSLRWSEVLTERANDAISHWIADGAYLAMTMSGRTFLTIEL